jgi:filamentous hemagglutinin
LGKTRGGIKSFETAAGTSGRDRDFDAIPGAADNKGGGVKVKILPDGRIVISRPNDTDQIGSGGTIEVQRPDGRPVIKVRY